MCVYECLCLYVCVCCVCGGGGVGQFQRGVSNTLSDKLSSMSSSDCNALLFSLSVVMETGILARSFSEPSRPLTLSCTNS